jgi:lipase maturation factor 1
MDREADSHTTAIEPVPTPVATAAAGTARRGRASRIFKAALAFVFVAAFLSMAAQLKSLAGSHGLLPLAEHLERIRSSTSAWPDRVHSFPTIFWLGATDRALVLVPLAGAVLALLWLAGAGGRVLPLALWCLYLSCVTAGRDFFFYQWDNLLLEASFLAIALPGRGWLLDRLRRRPPPEPSPILVGLVRWLLFRLLIESAIAKLIYGWEDWLTLPGMTFYYETAPLPSWGGWLVQQWPLWFHKASVFITFFCELILPFLLFARQRKLRIFFFVAHAGFQATIGLTSNYGFFNLLAVALSLAILEDDDLLEAEIRIRRWLRRPVPSGRQAGGSPATRPATVFALMVAALVVPASIVEGAAYFDRGPFLNQTLAPIRRLYAPFRSINVYHLFPGIVRQRIVAEIQATGNGTDWAPCLIRYAPGDPRVPPPMTWLHNPRFPFTYSFFTLGRGPRDAEYFHNLVERICCDPGGIADLMEPGPFHDIRPQAVRLAFYRYRFGTWSDLRATGRYWLREEVRAPSGTHACSCAGGSIP